MARRLLITACEDFEMSLNEKLSSFENRDCLRVITKEPVSRNNYSSADPEIYQSLFNFGISIAGSIAANYLYDMIKEYVHQTKKTIKIHNGVKRIEIDYNTSMNEEAKESFIKDFKLADEK